MPQHPSITLESRGGIHGTLHYALGSETYAVAYEHTGDYQRGLLVFIKELDAQLKCDAPQRRRSQILRDLQTWSKRTGQKLTW